MRIRLDNLSAFRPIRFVLAVFACAFLVFSYALPAYSDTPQPTARPSAPQSGEANLLDIEKEAQKTVLEDPYSREETQAKTNKGLNEIQGTANVENMKRPENTQASDVEEKSVNFLEALTGRK